MKQIRNLIFAIAAILSAIIVVNGQTQKFDVMTFTPPKGWTQQQNSNAKVFSTVDKSTSKICLMMIYPSIDSNGNANDDFKYVWKKLVQNAFNAGGNP